jgi:hypothetical protein
LNEPTESDLRAIEEFTAILRELGRVDNDDFLSADEKRTAKNAIIAEENIRLTGRPEGIGFGKPTPVSREMLKESI